MRSRYHGAWRPESLVRVAQDRVRRRIPRAVSPAFVLATPDAEPDLPALSGEPVLAADFLATQRRFVLAVLAVVAIPVELGLQLARAELGHQRIVEVPQPGDLVGNHVLRDGEVADGCLDAIAIVVLERPLGVVEHRAEDLEIGEPRLHVPGGLGTRPLLETAPRPVDELFLVSLLVLLPD